MTLQDISPWLAGIVGSVMLWVLARMYFKSVVVHLIHVENANGMDKVDMSTRRKTMVVIAKGFAIPSYEHYSFLLVCNFNVAKTLKKLSSKTPKGEASVYTTLAKEPVHGFQTLQVWIPYTTGVNLNESLYAVLASKTRFWLIREPSPEGVQQ